MQTAFVLQQAEGFLGRFSIAVLDYSSGGHCLGVAACRLPILKAVECPSTLSAPYSGARRFPWLLFRAYIRAHLQGQHLRWSLTRAYIRAFCPRFRVCFCSRPYRPWPQGFSLCHYCCVGHLSGPRIALIVSDTAIVLLYPELGLAW